MSYHAWQPSSSIAQLRKRADIISDIRRFFKERGYLEVETPILARHGVTDVYLSNIKAQFRGEDYCLQTSPEYHMKRLIAAGSGPIFQLARAFRDDELGRWHNPEFTLLEWYQLHVDHHGLMAEMDDFLQRILGCERLKKTTYQQAFLDACDLDPFHTNAQQLQNTVRRFALQDVLAKDAHLDQYLFLLMSHVVEPALALENRPVALYHFPPSQAALAQINHGVAERFEVYYRGVELANGFHELTDAQEQRRRFQQDNVLRQQLNQEPLCMDEYLLQAIQHGLPPCSGVALGVERLLALQLNQPSIAQTMAFDFSRA